MMILGLMLSMVFTGAGSAFAAIARDDMPTLNIKKLAEFDRPSGASFLEGGTVTSSDYLMAFLNSSGNTQTTQNPILGLNVSTWQQSRTGSAALSHANDMCYVPGTGEVYVTPMDGDNPRVIVLNETDLSLNRTIQLSYNYHAIGYDTAQNCFAAIYATGSGTGRRLVCNILDSTLANVKKSFSISSNLTYQGAAAKDSKLYYSCWERGSTSTYEPVYDGVLQKNDNVIYVYDYSGNLLKTYLINPPAGYNKFEIETVSFLGNRMILQFNEVLSANGANKIGLYEVTGENKSANQIAAEAAQAEAARKADEEFQKQDVTWSKLARQKVKITSISKKKRSIKLKWKKMKLNSQKVTGYEVQVCRSKSFMGNTLKTMKVTKVKCKVAGLQRKKKYYVRVRAYKTIGNYTWYSRWSKTKKVRTK